MSTSSCTPCSDTTQNSASTTIVSAGKYASVLDEYNNHKGLEPKKNAILHHRDYGNFPVRWATGAVDDRIKLELHGVADQSVAKLVAVDSDGRLQTFYPDVSGGRKILVSQSGNVIWEDQGEANKWFESGVIGNAQGQCQLSVAAFAGCDGNGTLELVKLEGQPCGYLRPNGTIDYPVPAGTILMFGGTQNAVPDNFLLCDGDLYSSSDYSDLFNAIGYNYGGSGSSFRVPDFRGLFPRGADLGAGVDPDAAGRVEGGENSNVAENPGSYQDDAVQCHEHTGGGVTVTTQNTTVGIGGSKKIWYVSAVVSDGVTGGIQKGTCDEEPRQSTETRPKNLAVNFIISTGC